MHIHQTRRIFDTLFHCIFAVNTDLITADICADIRLAGVNSILRFLDNDLLIKVAGVRIIVCPDFGRSRQAGLLGKEFVNRRFYGIHPDFVARGIRMQQVGHNLDGQSSVRIQEPVVDIQAKDGMAVGQR